MTLEQLFNSRNGSYAFKFLIHLEGIAGTDFYLVNNKTSVTYGGHTYLPAGFSYSPNQMIHGFYGGGKLDISSCSLPLAQFVESFRNVKLSVVAVVLEDSGVRPVNFFSHCYGSASVERGKIVFTFDRDDRLNMTFPSTIFTALNNKGNA